MTIKGILRVEELSKYRKIYSSLKNKVQRFDFLNVDIGNTQEEKIIMN
jgi:hypothetical protein